MPENRELEWSEVVRAARERMDRRHELLRAAEVDREALDRVDAELRQLPTLIDKLDDEALRLVHEAAAVLRKRPVKP